MRIGVIFCSCAGQITEKIDFSKIEELIKNKISWIKSCEVICTEDKKNEIINFLRKKRPEAVLFLACSPLNKEEVFREIATKAGVNPYMINVVNLREHVAWVTLDKKEALKKAYVLCIAALGRIKKQKPLIARKIPITDDILIVGGGVAGITAAKTLSKAGRKVYLVEKETALGGKVTKYEKIFPDLSCGPCFVHPLVSDLLDSSIELMLNSELIEIKGFYGNIHAKIKTKPIYVDYKKCIGCSACEYVCPEKAIRVYPMRLPPVAVVDSDRCLRFKEKMCSYCINECPVESIDFSEEQKELNLKVGVVLWATGFRVFDCSSFPQLGYRKFKDIYDALEFEEILNAEGPTKGELVKEDGQIPHRIIIIHCVGSLEEKYYPYCSKICCQYAFKFNRVIRQRVPHVEIIHFVKEVVIPGSEAYKIYFQIKKDPLTKIYRYNSIDDLRIEKKHSLTLYFNGESIVCDIVVLCSAIIPEEFPKTSGVFPIGSAKEPMSIKETIKDALAQTAEILSELKKSDFLIKSPIVVKINQNKCSLCGICLLQCPYKAIESEDGKIKILEVLCEGCGSCVSSCPTNAIDLEGDTKEQILSEIEGIINACKEIERWQL